MHAITDKFYLKDSILSVICSFVNEVIFVFTFIFVLVVKKLGDTSVLKVAVLKTVLMQEFVKIRFIPVVVFLLTLVILSIGGNIAIW